MVNIIDDDIWNAEPALRPEDEMALGKLHDMLQSTADDLKLLTGELSKYHEPGVQEKSSPTPLDDDFNEKVHIEELVNAKFHGYKVVDKSKFSPDSARNNSVQGLIKSMASEKFIPKMVNAGIQVNQVPFVRKTFKRNKLEVTRPKIIQIDERNIAKKAENSGQSKEIKPIVAYKEISFKYIEPTIKKTFLKPLQVQIMPSINIRSELREQKVLQINIDPTMDSFENADSKSNVAVISVQHEPVTVQKIVPNTKHDQVQYSMVPAASREPTRKFSKLSSYESSDSCNNMNDEIVICRTKEPHRTANSVIQRPNKIPESENIKNKRKETRKKEPAKRTNLDVWKMKLNTIYGGPTSSRQLKKESLKNKASKTRIKPSSATLNLPVKNTNTLNNAEYIPYSKLTLGGVKLSDIEKELLDVPNRSEITLDPILDKILSRENSYHSDSPRRTHENKPNILSTSDENLLRAVLDIEKKVGKTLSNNLTESNDVMDQTLNDADDHDTYIDDFEDEKSDHSVLSEEQIRSGEVYPEEKNSGESRDGDNDNRSLETDKQKMNETKTFSKVLNLSFKNKVDVFEFVHSVDTQEIATQSNRTKKISLKETQTSPRNDVCNVQPIHNDLWPSIDPKGEVEKLFKLEKDFIKKLIVEEYGDLLEKNVNKPSTSKDRQINDERNVVAFQKNTQTTPARVKSVMTSPTRTKTRTTSPLAASLAADQQTSPMMLEELNINIDDGDDLGISINLSSPRFSLRLPTTSREVLSNLETHAPSKHSLIKNNVRESRVVKKSAMSSSTSADGDYSSSDMSSLGEVRFKLRRRLQKLQHPSISELSSSPSLSKCSSVISDAIIPLRSEGEVSFGQARRKPSTNNKSEGEMSLGRLY